VEIGTKLFKQVARELCEIHKVVEVYGTTTEFDLMIKARASSRDELSEILATIRSIYEVDDISVSSIFKVFKEEHTLPLKDP
jgi:DNA-binding Lrp family transcriptional regulator